MLYAQQKQYDKAKQALEMAIRTHPSYATAHENLGDIYAKLASQAYDKALQIDSSNTSAQTKLSMIQDLMGNSGRPSPARGRGQADAVAAAEPKAVDTKPEPAKPVDSQAGRRRPNPSKPKPAAAKPAEPSPPPRRRPRRRGDATADVTKRRRGLGPGLVEARTSKPTWPTTPATSRRRMA